MALLEKIGLCETGPEFHNLSVPHLYREILQRSEAILSEDGAIVAETGTYTGRSPDDKFIVREPSSEKDVWWGDVNRPFLGDYNSLFNKVTTHLANRAVFVQDLFAGADPNLRGTIYLRATCSFAPPKNNSKPSSLIGI